MRARAVVIAQPHTVELRELELTEPGPADVVIRTAYSSISAGTERMVLAGKMPHPAPVSYTHLDVYKRQIHSRATVTRPGLRFWRMS